MTQEHPIAPPPELVQQWINEEQGVFAEHIAIQAARWGADQELKACCLWVAQESRAACRQLKAHRRPKPPSLKEQSIALIDKIQGNKESWQTDDLDVVRRALESLPD